MLTTRPPVWNLLIDLINKNYNEIGDKVLKYLESVFSSQISILLQSNTIVKLDHELPDQLGLDPDEKEIFYLTNYVCYSLKYYCYRLIGHLSKESLKIALQGKSRQAQLRDHRE